MGADWLLRVLIASPGDVQEARDRAERAIHIWNAANAEALGGALLPVRWELDCYPEAGGRTQGIVNRQIVDSADLLVGVFWSRLGTPTGAAESGTVEEIARFIERQRPVMLYFSRERVDPYETDLEQLARVRAFRQRFEKQGQGLVATFASQDEFEKVLVADLSKRVPRLIGKPAGKPEPSERPRARTARRAFPHPQFNDMTGRSDDILSLEIALKSNRVVLIHGEPGIGKTYVGSELAKKLSLARRRTIWIDGVTRSFADLEASRSPAPNQSEPVEEGGDRAERIRIANLVYGLNRRREILFLDSQFIDQRERQKVVFLVERMSQHASHARLILLSMEPFLDLEGKVFRHKLGGLTTTEGREYLLERTRRLSNWTDAQLVQVIEQTEGHPLMLNLIVRRCLAGESAADILASLRDRRSGFDGRFIQEATSRLIESEREALRRISLFRTAVDESAWSAVGLDAKAGPTLAARGWLNHVGQGMWRMHGVLREFWYQALPDRAAWHSRAGEYLYERAQRDPVPDTAAYFEAAYHFRQAGLPDRVLTIHNELIGRLHATNCLSFELATDRQAEWLELGATSTHAWLALIQGLHRHRKGGQRALDEARGIFEEAGVQFLKVGDQVGHAVAKYYLAKNLIGSRRAREALNVLSDLKDAPDPRLANRALSLKAACHADLDSYQEAMVAAEDARVRAEEADDEMGRAMALYRHADIERKRSNFDSAEKAFAECELLFAKVGDPYHASKTLARRGMVLGYLGRLNESASTLQRAVNLAHELDDTFGEARALDYYGDTCVLIGRFHEARKHYEDAKRLKRSIAPVSGDHRWITGLNKLARLALLVGDVKQAQGYIEQAEEDLPGDDRHASPLRAVVLRNRGELELNRGNLRLARALTKKSIAASSGPNPTVRHSQAKAGFQDGKIALLAGKLARARRILADVRVELEALKMEYDLALLDLWAARVEVSLGSHFEALALVHRAKERSAKNGARYLAAMAEGIAAEIEETAVVSAPNEVELGMLDRVPNVARGYETAIRELATTGAAGDAAYFAVRRRLWALMLEYLTDEKVELNAAYRSLADLQRGLEAFRRETVRVNGLADNLDKMPTGCAERLAGFWAGALCPLMRAFGFDEADDIAERAFRFLHKDDALRIQTILDERFPRKEETEARLRLHIPEVLRDLGIEGSVSVRIEPLHAVQQKALERGVEVEAVLDIIRCRISTGTATDLPRLLIAIEALGEGSTDAEATPSGSHDAGQREATDLTIRYGPQHQVVEFQLRSQERAAGVGGEQRAWVSIECPVTRIGEAGACVREVGGLKVMSIDLARPPGMDLKRVLLHLNFGAYKEPATPDHLRRHFADLSALLASKIPESVTRQLRSRPEYGEADRLELVEKAELLRRWGERSTKYTYVLTPRGDVKKLRKGSKVLDLAYRIHAQKIGAHCTGAIVNSQHVGVDAVLRNGDCVEITKAPEPQLDWSWAAIATTPRVRQLIQAELRARGGRERTA
jgi:tetratricopeptide (TPR) repeat protein